MPALALSFRRPVPDDAPGVHGLACAAGKLDVNSRYAYLLVCSHFAATSVVAEEDGRLAGFLSAYRLPEDAETLFVWQVAVDGGMRGRGIGRRMLERVAAEQAGRGVRFVEATVSADNVASQGLFRGFARRLATPCAESEGFGPALFLPEAHEAEPLYRIGPLPDPVMFPQDISQ